MKKTITLLLCSLILLSCSDDNYTSIPSNLDLQLYSNLLDASDGQGKAFFIFPESDDFDNIPQDPLNPITKEKVLLGKMLLHETATGGNPKIEGMQNTYSCASCHQAAAGFSAGLRQGIGECGIGFGFKGEGRIINSQVPVDSVDIQPLRSPTILNVAYQDVMLWNGQFGGTGTNEGTQSSWGNIPENFEGFQGIEVQAIKGQKVHRLQIDSDFVNANGYKTLFDNAYPNIPIEERYTKKTGALAMAAYERTLLANRSPWQQYLKGDIRALSDTEKRGAIAFFGTGRCYECHTGPALNDKKFHAFGMGDFDNTNQAIIPYDTDPVKVSKGRGGFTGNPQDDYKFKTPTLYNIADNGFYGHGATFTSIKELIIYKQNGIPQNTEVPQQNLASQFGNTQLSEQEINDMVQFIKNSLKDPDLNRYVPEAINSGFCFPNNDEGSRVDLGCD